MRPSILKQETPAASSCGSTPIAERSLVDMIARRLERGRARAPQGVAQAARLAAAAAVAAAAAHHAAQQAVAGVAVAQRPVDEGLELEPARLERGDLGETELARQDGAREAEPPQRLQLRRAVRVQLRAGVERQVRILLAHARGEAEVGDDERVEAGEVRRLQRRQRRLHLVVLEQRVERQVRARVVQVGGLDRLRRAPRRRSCRRRRARSSARGRSRRRRRRRRGPRAGRAAPPPARAAPERSRGGPRTRAGQSAARSGRARPGPGASAAAARRAPRS